MYSTELVIGVCVEELQSKSVGIKSGLGSFRDYRSRVTGQGSRFKGQGSRVKGQGSRVKY
jgi:hypothetical protein